MSGNDSAEVGAGISRDHFMGLLRQAVDSTMRKAQEDVGERLPQDYCYQLSERAKEERLTVGEVVDALFHGGHIPRLIDIAVRGIAINGQVVVWLRPSAHPWVADVNSTWDPSGLGPFKVVGLLIPSFLWERPRPFRLDDLRESMR